MIQTEQTGQTGQTGQIKLTHKHDFPGILVTGRFRNSCDMYTFKNAMKHMISSFKMRGDAMSDHFLMLWFQKDSLDTVGFRTYDGGSRVLNQKVTFGVLNLPLEGVGGHQFRTKSYIPPFLFGGF